VQSESAQSILPSPSLSIPSVQSSVVPIPVLVELVLPDDDDADDVLDVVAPPAPLLELALVVVVIWPAPEDVALPPPPEGSGSVNV
jgi:hypothetical protein